MTSFLKTKCKQIFICKKQKEVLALIYSLSYDKMCDKLLGEYKKYKVLTTKNLFKKY